jgi:hypothetical protein
MRGMPEEEFAFEEWLAEGLRGLRSYLTGEKVLPKEFAEHARAAQKETLLAIRSLFEPAIQRAGERPEKTVTKIKVQ